MEEIKKRYAMCQGLFQHSDEEMKINDRAVCAQLQDGNIYKIKPFINKDTNSKYLSF